MKRQLMQKKPVNFFKRYNRIVISTFSFVVLMSSGLLYLKFDSQYKHKVEQLKEQFEKRSLNLDYWMKSATDQIDGVQIQGQAFLAAHPNRPQPSPFFSQFQESNNTFHLDRLGPLKDNKAMGNIIGFTSLKNQSPDFYRDLEMAWSLNSKFQTIFHAIPNVAWVYYVSKHKFVNNLPWLRHDEVGTNAETMNNDFYVLGLPENNPKRERFWTRPYVDENGSGLMVTLAIPIYDNDNFFGTACLDFTLDALTHFVVDDRDQKTTMFVVDRYSNLLAHPTLVSSKDKDVKLAQSALPEGMAIDRVFQKPPDSFHQVGTHLIIYQNLKNVPWKTVLLIPQKEIVFESLWETSLSFVLLLPGIALILGITTYMTRKEFIRPAEQLVQHNSRRRKGN